MHARRLALAALVVSLLAPRPAQADARTFEAGSLIVPMDLAYQDHGLLQAYGLVFQLLRQGVPVSWVIDPAKTWHAAPCDTPGDTCAWDCAEEGSGVKCPYPTASPDFYAGATVLWDGDRGTPEGTAIARHGYRGGPFVIAAADAERARGIVDAWNDPSRWDANPWARRTVTHVVTVHVATAPFVGDVRRSLLAAPTLAVFSDGNEDIATGYLRAAGIPQSNGTEFPASRCAAGLCGPGTANPDMLTVESIMGEMGTCDAPNVDHRNGALFTSDGVPAYCQIMSMHWAVNDRETVECDGGRCPASAAECAGRPFTYHGHEVVAEVRQFLSFPTHFFAECQAVNAYENTVPNPAWPYLDDADRLGHFLTTVGTPPDCPCSDPDFSCVAGGCDGGARDCCLPRDVRERGAGFLIAPQPAGDSLRVLSPHVPYNQLDGAFDTVGGSEPAYNLSATLGTTYTADVEVTMLTGPMGPGDQDLWLTGYRDGVCDITQDEFADPAMCALGKVSYLGGHRYATSVPVSAHPDTQGTRLFLNALFEADCVTDAAQALVGLAWSGRSALPPSDEVYTVRVANGGRGAALDTRLTVTVPAGVEIVDVSVGGIVSGSSATWPLGSLGASGSSAPPSAVSPTLTLRFAADGEFTLEASVDYRVGASPRTVSSPYVVTVGPEVDGGGLDGGGEPRSDGGGRADAASGVGTGSTGCGCRAVTPRSVPRLGLALLALSLAALARRRR